MTDLNGVNGASQTSGASVKGNVGKAAFKGRQLFFRAGAYMLKQKRNFESIQNSAGRATTKADSTLLSKTIKQQAKYDSASIAKDFASGNVSEAKKALDGLVDLCDKHTNANDKKAVLKGFIQALKPHLAKDDISLKSGTTVRAELEKLLPGLLTSSSAQRTDAKDKVMDVLVKARESAKVRGEIGLPDNKANDAGDCVASNVVDGSVKKLGETSSNAVYTNTFKQADGSEKKLACKKIPVDNKDNEKPEELRHNLAASQLAKDMGLGDLIVDTQVVQMKDEGGKVHSAIGMEIQTGMQGRVKKQFDVAKLLEIVGDEKSSKHALVKNQYVNNARKALAAFNEAKKEVEDEDKDRIEEGKSPRSPDEKKKRLEELMIEKKINPKPNSNLKKQHIPFAVGENLELLYNANEVIEKNLDADTLQIQMNRVSAFDFIIAGKDRNAENFFLKTDGNGTVSGVKCHDNDESFSSSMLALPVSVESHTRDQILAYTADKMWAVLSGAGLSDTQVEDACSRLAILQDYLAAYKAAEGENHSGDLVKDQTNRAEAALKTVNKKRENGDYGNIASPFSCQEHVYVGQHRDGPKVPFNLQKHGLEGAVYVPSSKE